MDIEAQHAAAKKKYDEAAAAMEAAGTNGDRLSNDPKKRAAAEDAFQKACDVAAATYQEFEDLDDLVKKRAKRAGAK